MAQACGEEALRLRVKGAHRSTAWFVLSKAEVESLARVQKLLANKLILEMNVESYRRRAAQAAQAPAKRARAATTTAAA